MSQAPAGPLRVGVIGAGWFASRRHLPDLVELPGVEVVAACRRDQEALARFCDHFGIPGRYGDFHKMLDRESLDAVVIASPHACHYEQAMECLHRDLHILLEKPLALTSAEGEELCAVAESRRKVLLVGLNPPYWPFCHLSREWIRDGRLGQLEAVEIAWINSAGPLFGKGVLPEKLPGVVRPTGFRSDAALGGGGHLMDGGQHNISELLWVTGSLPTNIAASMDRLPVDLRASVSITLENGAVASITGLVDSRLGTRRAHSTYFGSEGTIRVSVAPFVVTLDRPGHELETVEEAGLPVVLSPAADLLRCITTGEPPLGSSLHALQTTRVIEAAYQSAGRSAVSSVSVISNQCISNQ